MANIIVRPKRILHYKIYAVLMVFLIISSVPLYAQGRDSVYSIEIAKFSHPEIEEFVRNAVVPFSESSNFNRSKGVITVMQYGDSENMIYVAVNFCPTALSKFEGYICDIGGMPVFTEKVLAGKVIRPIGKTAQVVHYCPGFIEQCSACDDEVVWIFELDGDSICLTEVLDYGLRLNSDYAKKYLIPLHQELYDR